MKRMLLASILVISAIALLGCGSQTAEPIPEIDTATAVLSDYQKNYPGKPELAAYQYRLQKKIDQCYFEAIRALHFSKGPVPTSPHSFTITLVVRAAGNIGATDAEMKHAASNEPALATAAFNALAAANENPEPFSEQLKQEIGTHFVYPARFGIR